MIATAALRRVAAFAFELGRRLAGLHHHRDKLAAAAALPHQLGRQLHDRLGCRRQGLVGLGPQLRLGQRGGALSASAWARERAAEPCPLSCPRPASLCPGLPFSSILFNEYLGWQILASRMVTSVNAARRRAGLPSTRSNGAHHPALVAEQLVGRRDRIQVPDGQRNRSRIFSRWPRTYPCRRSADHPLPYSTRPAKPG